MLLETDAGKDGLEFANGCVAANRCSAEQSEPAKLFRAVEVRLGSPDEADLVVIGVCPMCGADNGWFWLVRLPYKNPSVVLWSGGNCLQLLRSRTHDLSDVRSTWSSGAGTRTTTYRFDGREYKRWKEKRRENRP